MHMCCPLLRQYQSSATDQGPVKTHNLLNLEEANQVFIQGSTLDELTRYAS